MTVCKSLAGSYFHRKTNARALDDNHGHGILYAKLIQTHRNTSNIVQGKSLNSNII